MAEKGDQENKEELFPKREFTTDLRLLYSDELQNLPSGISQQRVVIARGL
jgi:hypothetical protein